MKTHETEAFLRFVEVGGGANLPVLVILKQVKLVKMNNQELFWRGKGHNRC